MEIETPETDSAIRADVGGPVQADTATDEVLADELIEDVSIDGMCGVY